MVIFSKVAACTSQPVVFNEHPSTHGRLTGLRNKPQKKQTSQLVAVVLWQLVISLMQLLVGDEKRSLPIVCVSGGFWQIRLHMENIAHKRVRSGWETSVLQGSQVLVNPETTLCVIHLYIIINIGQAGNVILKLHRKICYSIITELLLYPQESVYFMHNVKFYGEKLVTVPSYLYVNISSIFNDNGPYSLFVCASYFIPCSVHARFPSVTFIDCKWRWGYRHFWTSRISMFCIEAIELIIR